MTADDDLEDAIQLATERTIEAQETVAAEIDARRVPLEPLAAVVVHRAEDVETLVEESAEESVARS